MKLRLHGLFFMHKNKIMEVIKMAGMALTTIGVIVGFGIGTDTTPPVSWTEIEECTSISEVTTDREPIDVTPLKSDKRKYAAGYASTSETVDTTFNMSDVFEAQWNDVLTKYESMESTQRLWLCAYHPSRKKMDVYVVTPGMIPRTAYEVGNALQVTIKNTILDLPDPITAAKPNENTVGNE